MRPAIFNGLEQQVQVFDRDRLRVGEALRGPALIEESSSTTSVPPEWTAILDRTGCIAMRRA
jgi:N-methylhydantoinase A/oxoprolinase/acetone carboxylase beta subunit